MSSFKPTADCQKRAGLHKNSAEFKAANRARAEKALEIALAERDNLLEENVAQLGSPQRVLRKLRAIPDGD